LARKLTFKNFEGGGGSSIFTPEIPQMPSQKVVELASITLNPPELMCFSEKQSRSGIGIAKLYRPK
jgi:hypothetical protein